MQQQHYQRVAVLGATGSIGTSALDVIARHRQQMRASVLVAGSNVRGWSPCAQPTVPTMR
jgi:1-deoxy-D-xylulose 5-phosphate reductoisomerase